MLLLHPAPWAQATTAPCHPRAHDTIPSPLPPSHCSELLRPRLWSHRRSAHTFTSDTSSTATASAPVPQDPSTVIVPHACDSRTGPAIDQSAKAPDLAPRGICSARTSSHGQKRRTRRPQQYSPLRTLIALAVIATHRTSTVFDTGDLQSFPQH